VDAYLIAEAVTTINVLVAQSLGVPSQPPIRVVVQSLTALGGGRVSVAQPSSGGVGFAFSYLFGVAGPPPPRGARGAGARRPF